MKFFDNRVESLWSNPNRIDLNSKFLYFVSITDDKGKEYRYIGKARDGQRLREYRNNMLKIKKGRERGSRQNYRAVHFAIYKALQNGWKIDFYPLETCTKEEINQLEQQRKIEYKCNLNDAKTWRVSHMKSLTIDELLR